jgi:hypothetical protein
MGFASRAAKAKAWATAGRLALLLLVAACAGAAAGQQDTARHLVATIQMALSADVVVGVAVALDASGSSHDVPLDLVDDVRYTWNLGDATMQVGERIVHAYALPGTYRVVLTLDVFESTGIYHRGTATTTVTVLPAETAPQAAVFDLETGFATGLDSGATALTWLQPLPPTQQPAYTAASEPTLPEVGSSSADLLKRLVFSGGIVTVGELTLWSASLGVDVLDGGVLLLAGYGRSTRGVTVSLTDGFPAVRQTGGEIAAEIQDAMFYSLGIGYRTLPRMYIVADLALLVVEGVYMGSSRVTIDGHPLPVPFSEGTASFGVGIAFRVGAIVVSAKLLFPM